MSETRVNLKTFSTQKNQGLTRQTTSNAAIEQNSEQTSIVKSKEMKIDEPYSDLKMLKQQAFDTAPFQIENPTSKLFKDLDREVILEKPEDESMLLKASGFSLNTTNLVNKLEDDLESVLSLQPEKLNLRNLY